MPNLHFSELLKETITKKPIKFREALCSAIRDCRSEHKGWFGGLDKVHGKRTQQEKSGRLVISTLVPFADDEITTDHCISALRFLVGSQATGSWNIGQGSFFSGSYYTSYKVLVMTNLLKRLGAAELVVEHKYERPNAKPEVIEALLRSIAEKAFHLLNVSLPEGLPFELMAVSNHAGIKHSPTPVYQQFTDMALDSTTAEPHEEPPQHQGIEPK
ncbi:hypothetical protein [Piscirickettsia salmonis]|uniref:hypothetical protein n=1 Tax=Piscirickettsia salmonis TaxID=1238 RepID=UPI0007C88494|nr:hypothetical protein A0O36_02551 [Piscirickettsiaceae bacterium NZ-RLO1]